MGNTPSMRGGPAKKGNIAITEGGAGQNIELGKKLKQTGHYTGYFWAARDKKGQTHVRGFFAAHGAPGGRQSKHSYIG